MPRPNACMLKCPVSDSDEQDRLDASLHTFGLALRAIHHEVSHKDMLTTDDRSFLGALPDPDVVKVPTHIWGHNIDGAHEHMDFNAGPASSHTSWLISMPGFRRFKRAADVVQGRLKVCIPYSFGPGCP